MTFRPKFWKPGTEGPGANIQLEKSSVAEGSNCTQSEMFDSRVFFFTAYILDSNHVAAYNPFGSMSIDHQRQRLPIFACRNHILYLLEANQVVVIVGETGSGKSTQIPQYLYESGWLGDNQLVGVVQPRRMAAVTVATRVAEELGTVIGHRVGYAIRFEDCSSSATRIRFITDGLLVREIMDDPLLSKYTVIMLDEAHERTLYNDICIGLLRKITQKRTDLKLIISSATLDAEKFRDFFAPPGGSTKGAILSVEGRRYPVEILYSLDPVPDYVKATVETVMKIHLTEKEGDILAFLTGSRTVNHFEFLTI